MWKIELKYIKKAFNILEVLEIKFWKKYSIRSNFFANYKSLSKEPVKSRVLHYLLKVVHKIVFTTFSSFDFFMLAVSEPS